MHASPRSASVGFPTVAVAVALGGLLVGCQAHRGRTTAARAPVVPVTAGARPGPAPTVTLTTIQDHADSPPYDVAVQMPVVHGSAADAKVNGAIDGPAQTLVNQFLDEVRQQGPAPAGVDPTDPSARSSLTCRTETRLLDARLASFRVSCSSYHAGAANSEDSVMTLNFDLAGGRLLALADLFRPEGDYLAFLSQSAISQLDARYDDDADARRGAGPSADNFAAWSLTPTALEVTFGGDQVGPHTIGTPTVVLAYPSLMPYLRHPGPLDTP